MKPSTLKSIKLQVKPLIGLLEAYSKTKGIKEELLTALIVELQNFCHEWSDCQGYTYEEDLSKCRAIYSFLEEVKSYEKDFHFIVYLVDEFSMIYEGNSMNEDVEEELVSEYFPYDDE